MQRIVSLFQTVSSVGALMPIRNGNALSSIFATVKKELLTPSTPLANQVCGFKLRGRVTRRCASCYLVLRDGRMYNICPKHPRHKQMAMRPKPHNTWILTHASQSRVRPW